MSHVIISRQEKVGYITLDRPKALNSLTHQMIEDIHIGLREHEANDKVEVIVLRSSSERALCAGGDMKATRLLALDEQWDELQQFFKKEYELNLHIAQCAKPYVTLVNGIAMGGGLGLSVHGDVLVVSETARMAMPETAIGFFPDVGGTYFLSRLAYDSGLWLALTGAPVFGKEAVAVGLATHYVPSAHWPELVSALEEGGSDAISTTLASLADTTQDEEFIKKLELRSRWFSADNYAELVSTLTDASSEYDDAAKLLQRVQSMSPYAMNLTRKLLAEAKNHNLETCLQLELAAADEAVRHPDFVEGVRAVLVDKEKATWQSE